MEKVSIQKIVPVDKWYFLKSETNPADIPTRLTVNFDDFFWDRWINGPEFLLSSPNLTFHDTDDIMTTNEAMILKRPKV